MSGDKKEPNTDTKEDEELSALLDSAVKDFQQSDDTVKTSEVKKPDTLWTEDFLQNTKNKFDKNLQGLFSPGPDGEISLDQIGANMQRIAEAATQSAGLDVSPDDEFSSIIAQTLRNLSENTNSLQNQISEEDLMNMIGSLGSLSEGSNDPGELLPFMEQMMQNLLKKDVLYPVLSSIIQKYPQWLEEHKGKIPDADYTQHEDQLKLMKDVCKELDEENSADSESVQKSRFDRILFLMQKECGQPPPELVSELGPVFPLDAQGNPQLPDSSQCSVM